MRLIFVPQYPSPMRYSSWWFTEFEKEFKKEYDEVIVIGKNSVQELKREHSHLFSPINLSIEFECQQIKEYMNLELRKDDVIFLSDISFPGIFPTVFFHKKVENMYAYIHGTSLNKFDYFQTDRKYKWHIESTFSSMFKKVFVATEYHKNKLSLKNLEVVGVPKPPFQTFTEGKKYDVISVVRDCNQKRTKKLEKLVENKFGKITRSENISSWEEYYKFLASGKILLSTAKEETFGYSIMEAIMNCTIPICSNKFSYSELLDRNYLYDGGEELLEKISYFLEHSDKVPKLLCQEKVDNFYRNIIKIMKGN